MPRIRTIKPEFWTDEKLALLPRDIRLIFIASWNYSDDYGVLKGSPLLLKSQFLPYDEDVTLSIFKDWINTLIEKEMFIPFIYKNEQYIFITNFSTHQKIDRPSKPLITLDTLTTILDEYSTNTRRILVGGKGIGREEDRDREEDREGERNDFSPPVFEDVFSFFDNKKNSTNWSSEKNKIEANKFIAYYAARNWMVGKAKFCSLAASGSGWITMDAEIQEKNKIRKNNYQQNKNGSEQKSTNRIEDILDLGDELFADSAARNKKD